MGAFTFVNIGRKLVVVPAAGVATGANGQWGYRIERSTNTVLQLTSVSQPSVINGYVVDPTVAHSVDITTAMLMAADGSATVNAVNTVTNAVVYVYYVIPPEVYGDSIAISQTAPAFVNGILTLSGAALPENYLYLGSVYLNATPVLVDSQVSRTVSNYYNQRWKRMFVCPGYNDNNAISQFTDNNAAWAACNAGTNAGVQFIVQNFFAGNGSYPYFRGYFTSGANAPSTIFVGVGIDSVTSAAAAGEFSGGQTPSTRSVEFDCDALALNVLHTATLLSMTNANNQIFNADLGRNGSVADVPSTYLIGQIMA